MSSIVPVPVPPMPHPTPLLRLTLVALALAGLVRPAAAFTPAEAKAPMTVTLVRGDAPGCGADCPEWLALTGAIGPGTPALFSAALARLGPRNVPVLVDSPGGAVQAAMAMGRAIRARRMTVAVAGTGLDDCAPADRACAARRRVGERPGFVAGGIAACASACVLVLAAGTERSVGPNSYVGVHQMVVHQTLTRVMNYYNDERVLSLLIYSTINGLGVVLESPVLAHFCARDQSVTSLPANAVSNRTQLLGAC